MSKKQAKPPSPCARVTEESTYIDRSRRMQNRATEAYATWVAQMSPDERRKLRDLNLEAAPEDESEVGGHSPFSLSDIADTPLARVLPDYAASIDKPHEILADEFGISAEKAARLIQWHNLEIQAAVDREKSNYLQLIIGGLLSSKNPKLNAAGLAFAANLAALNGLPCQREYARQNHISASALSKVVKAWSHTLGLRPSAHQKSEQACATYSEVGKKNHWRARTLTAGIASKLLNKMRPPTNPAHN